MWSIHMQITQRLHKPDSSTFGFHLCWVLPMGGSSGDQRVGRERPEYLSSKHPLFRVSLDSQNLSIWDPAPVSKNHSFPLFLSAKEGDWIPQLPAGWHCTILHRTSCPLLFPSHSSLPSSLHSLSTLSALPPSIRDTDMLHSRGRSHAHSPPLTPPEHYQYLPPALPQRSPTVLDFMSKIPLLFQKLF